MGFNFFVIKKSTAFNILKSEDVISAINCIKKLGAKVKIRKNKCEIIGTVLIIKPKKSQTKCWKFWNIR